MDEQAHSHVPALAVTQGQYARAVRGTGVAISLLAIAIIAAATLRNGDPAVLEPHGHWCLVCGRQGTVDVLQNLLLFAPLGIGLMVAGVPLRVAVLLAAGTSVTVELLQATVFVGRAGTLSDVLTNTTGATLAYIVARGHERWLAPDARAAPTLAAGWTLLWTMVAFGSAWALLPAPLPGPYQVMQIPPGSGVLRSFEGTILEARLGGVSLTPGIAEGGEIELAVIDPALEVEAEVIPMSYAPGKLRPIVSVHTGDWESLLILGQRNRDLIQQRRVNAGRALLRTPSVRLPEVFPATEERGERTRAPLRLEGESTAGSVTLRSSSALERRETRVSISPLHGWALLLPIPLDDSPRVGWLTSLWLFGWLLPIGYWSAAGVGRSRSWSSGFILPAGALALGAAAPWLAALATGLTPPASETMVVIAAAVVTGVTISAVARLVIAGR